jgi:transposase InsO family protein
VDFINYWAKNTELPEKRLVGLLGLGHSKFFDWKKRYGKVNEHNALIPRDFWLAKWEKSAIVEYYTNNEKEGYRRLAFMMLDANVVAASPSTVYRELKKAGVLWKWNRKESKKGKGFKQPGKAHEHWHIDVAYVNICGTFYYLCSVLDGYSREVLHFEIREKMTEMDVELLLERTKEKYPLARPRIISDNGPQFVAKDFKEFIRVSGMDHVRTSPFYPQSNGKIERWHRTVKSEAIRPKCPLSLEDAIRIVGEFVEKYNTRRLHSAIGYVTPHDKLFGRDKQIFADRDRKLEEARKRRAEERRSAREICKKRLDITEGKLMVNIA